jgi:hypothetical protein
MTTLTSDNLVAEGNMARRELLVVGIKKCDKWKDGQMECRIWTLDTCTENVDTLNIFNSLFLQLLCHKRVAVALDRGLR